MDRQGRFSPAVPLTLHNNICNNYHVPAFQREARQSLGGSSGFRGYLDHLNVNLLAECEDYPHEDMDEQYELRVSDDPADHLRENSSSNQSLCRLLTSVFDD